MLFSTFLFVAQLLWDLSLLWVALHKIVIFSLISYVVHFTNWGWSLSIFFYFATLAFIVPSRSADFVNVRCSANVVFCCFFPLGVVVWFIALSVYILLMKDPEFVVDIFEQLDPGYVMAGNDVFHVFPVIAWIFFFFLQFRLVFFAFNSHLADASPRRRFLWLLYQIVGGPLLFLLAYFVTLAVLGRSVNQIYKTEVPVASAVMFYVISGLLAAGVPLLVLISCCGLFSSRQALAEEQIYLTPYEYSSGKRP